MNCDLLTNDEKLNAFLHQFINLQAKWMSDVFVTYRFERKNISKSNAEYDNAIQSKLFLVLSSRTDRN